MPLLLLLQCWLCPSWGPWQRLMNMVRALLNHNNILRAYLPAHLLCCSLERLWQCTWWQTLRVLPLEEECGPHILEYSWGKRHPRSPYTGMLHQLLCFFQGREFCALQNIHNHKAMSHKLFRNIRMWLLACVGKEFTFATSPMVQGAGFPSVVMIVKSTNLYTPVNSSLQRCQTPSCHSTATWISSWLPYCA